MKAIPNVMLHFSQPIGNFMSGIAECHSPCINMTAGEITIDSCVSATLIVICYQVNPHLSLMVTAIFCYYLMNAYFSFFNLIFAETCD